MNSVRKWWNAIVYAKAVKTDDEGNQRGNPIDAARTLKFTDGDSEALPTQPMWESGLQLSQLLIEHKGHISTTV